MDVIRIYLIPAVLLVLWHVGNILFGLIKYRKVVLLHLYTGKAAFGGVMLLLLAVFYYGSDNAVVRGLFYFSAILLALNFFEHTLLILTQRRIDPNLTSIFLVKRKR